MKINKSIIVIITAVVFCAHVQFSNAQSKKERKAQLTTLDSDMYDGTEDKEAMEYYEMGIKYSQQGKYKLAIKYYEKAIKEDNTFVEAYDNIGLDYRRLGKLDDAIEYYNKSLELYPEGNMAHQNLAVIYNIRKQYDKALEEYIIIQKLDPDNPEGYYGATLSYFNQEKYDEAIEEGKKCIALYEAINSPYVGDVEYLLGISFYNKKDNKKAKIYLAKARKHGVKISESLIKELGL